MSKKAATPPGTPANGGCSDDRNYYTPLYCFRKRKFPPVNYTDQEIHTFLENIPAEVYKPSWTRCMLDLAQAMSLLLCTILVFTLLPWQYLPLGWVLAGAGMINLFNIGHDCAHKTWSPNQLLNNIIGEIVFLPLNHPYQAFRFKHIHKEEFLSKSAFDNREIEHMAHHSSLLSAMGTVGFFKEFYGMKGVNKQFEGRIRLSQSISLLYMTLFYGSIFYYHGIIGVVKFWLVPLMIYKDLLYTRWLEWARNGLDIHLPERVAVSVPSYNLRWACECIQDSLAKKTITERETETDLQNMKNDAFQQKEGSTAEGYDHKYGKEVQLKRYTSFTQFVGEINWVNSVILVGTPLISLYGAFTTTLFWQTALFSVAYYFYTGFGITAGYHRLWAHRSYKASPLVEWLLMLGGSGALEGSIKWWCGGHRVHHRYTDTPKDPYNAHAGFWFAHLGWMLMKPDPQYKAFADIRDLKSRFMVQIQHKYYAFFGPFMAFVFPCLFAGMMWGDYRGGFYYAGASRLLFVHHSTFCVNSVAHWFGNHTFDDERSPRDHFITALLTLGEGYHNFHHEFPNDYRNGTKWYHYDPTKWLIRFFAMLGLTYEMKVFPENEVAKGKLMMAQKRLDHEKAKLIYPSPVMTLTPMTNRDISRKQKEGFSLVVIDNLVHDVTNFVEEHPGGVNFIKSVVGKDGTEAFYGRTDIYKHSNAARHLLTTFRVGRLVESGSGYSSPYSSEPEFEESASSRKMR